MNEADLIAMNLSDSDRTLLLTAIKQLPIQQPLILQNNNNIDTITVDQWLDNIKLNEYVDIFK